MADEPWEWLSGPRAGLLGELAEVAGQFRQIPGCAVGGPLHVLIEDCNTEDRFLGFSVAELFAVPVHPEEPDPRVVQIKYGLTTHEAYRAWWRRQQTPGDSDRMVRLGLAILWGLSFSTEAERESLADVYLGPFG